MKTPLRALAALALLTAFLAPATRADEKLLTSEELRQLDRENEFWRQLRADEDAAASLARLRRSGATPDELRWFEPKLAKLWEVDIPRAWGWLRPEQIDAIKAIDRLFLPRVRAARLRAATGIEIDPAHRSETMLAVNGRWQRTLLRVLEYDQIAEFRLMNSESAQKTGRHFENVPLTDDERRTIYDWQREFEALAGENGARLRIGQRDVILDHRRRIRDLIGDDRFAIYFASAEPKFARMHDALGEDVDNTTALDAWWIREQFWIDQEKPREIGLSNRVLAARIEERLRARLGETLAARYLSSDDARWLTGYRVQVRGGSRATAKP
ncbi:MAG: hypothetical protein HZA32_20585 [Opitutae bacterium]|nr:hypothetical protein [Opitutae bacterium]